MIELADADKISRCFYLVVSVLANIYNSLKEIFTCSYLSAYTATFPIYYAYGWLVDNFGLISKPGENLILR